MGGDQPFALIHPAAALETKQWATENFARVTEALAARELAPIAIVSSKEKPVLQSLNKLSAMPVIGLDDLSLPEVTALAGRARLFVGNDSGIAHIAAAAGARCVVIFGSSNVAHWRPWTSQPHEVVREELACQPCHGYFCAAFDKPQCILGVPVERVIAVEHPQRLTILVAVIELLADGAEAIVGTALVGLFVVLVLQFYASWYQMIFVLFAIGAFLLIAGLTKLTALRKILLILISYI